MQTNRVDYANLFNSLETTYSLMIRQFQLDLLIDKNHEPNIQNLEDYFLMLDCLKLIVTMVKLKSIFYAMKIRLANKNDVLAITDCVTKAYQHYIKRLGKPPGPMLDNYTVVVAEHIVYVAETKGKVIGLFVLMENHKPLLLDNLAVDPAIQGKRIGTRLLRFAEQLARDKKHKAIQLYTHELMTENIDYYTKHGYKMSHKITQKGYDRIYMVKQL